MKFQITEELVTLMRTVRTQNNISAKDLAAHLGKSPSFISKLESGMVKTIKKETLTELLCYISGGASDFYGEILPNLLRVLQSFMAEDRLPAQAWLFHYDVRDRRVAVPLEMARDLTQKLETLEETAAEIAEFINENIDSGMAEAFPVNQVISLDYQGTFRLSFRSDISVKEVEDILSVQGYTTDLMTLTSLIFTIFRFSLFGKEKKMMPPEQAVQVLKNMDQYLEEYGVHSLIPVGRLASSEAYTSRQIPVLSAVPTAARQMIAEISAFFEEASARDALNTAEILKNFSNMLSWDPAFTMKLLGLPFTDLEGLSYQNKRKLIGEITEILNRYDALSDLEKRWEEY